MSTDLISLMKTHYAAFRSFLDNQDINAKQKQRVNAKEKLSKLSNQQFQELSTDVYDELIRRLYHSQDSHLISQPEFQTKRNDARAKLSKLQVSRYIDLARDIFNEIKRRFPNVAIEMGDEGEIDSNENISINENNKSFSRENNQNPNQPMYHKQQQQYNDQEINFAPLDDVMANLAKELAYRNNNEDSGSDNKGNDYLNSKLLELQKTNNDLKNKFEMLTKRAESEKERNEKELQNLQESLSNQIKINENQASEYSKLFSNYTSIQSELKNIRNESNANEKVINELRRENDNQIAKVNELTMKNESYENEIKKLKEEIQELKKQKEQNASINNSINVENNVQQKQNIIEKENKTDYPVSQNRQSQQNMRNPNRQSQQSNTNNSINSQNKGKEEESPSKQNNENENIKIPEEDCINPERFNDYKDAVNELIKASKSTIPTDVLVAMKSIVITCKNITEDSDEYELSHEATFTDEEQDRLNEVKTNLSVALTNLMNVTKNHAQRYPEIPSSFIESATSDLSTSIVSLVRILREHQVRILNQPEYLQNQPQSQQPQSQPQSQQLKNNEFTPNSNEEAYSISDLKIFLENKTDLIVQGIQTLLSIIRQANSNSEDFNKTIKHITEIVDNVISASQNTFSSQLGIHLYQRGAPILQELKIGNFKLKEMGDSIEKEPQSKPLKQRLASASYEIAVYVRELIELLG